MDFVQIVEVVWLHVLIEDYSQKLVDLRGSLALNTEGRGPGTIEIFHQKVQGLDDGGRAEGLEQITGKAAWSSYRLGVYEE